MTDETASASLAEIRDLLRALPAPPPLPADMPDAPDFLETLTIWLAAWQGGAAPRLGRPRAAFYLGRYGDGGAEAALAIAESFQSGDAPAFRLCSEVDAELRLYEMALDATGTLDDAACATAMAYGMTAVEDGLDLLCVAGIGPGVDAAGDALAASLAGGADDPLEMLRRHGGHALAAMAGTVIAARMARVPVILDGIAAVAAAAALHGADETVLDHCVVGPLDPARAHRPILDLIGKEPLADFGMPVAPGCGGLIALAILRGAAAYCVPAGGTDTP